MKVLVACEESQAVTIELRKLGHEAYSCDIIECSGGHPEWHIQGDVLPLLNGSGDDYGKAMFVTQDNVSHFLPKKWDMIIDFPPCTHLAVSGARHFGRKRADGRQREGEAGRARKLMEEAPAIDAVKVVRCEDCVLHNYCGFEQIQGLKGFCSYGERKDNETD